MGALPAVSRVRNEGATKNPSVSSVSFHWIACGQTGSRGLVGDARRREVMVAALTGSLWLTQWLVQIVIHSGKGAGAQAHASHESQALRGLAQGKQQRGLFWQVLRLWRKRGRHIVTCDEAQRTCHSYKLPPSPHAAPNKDLHYTGPQNIGEMVCCSILNPW